MSLGVLNNIAAIYAQNNLNLTQSSLQNTLTQLSSGSRINSGADDAAGLAVADGLHANVAALTQSAQNAQNGIGLLQTADGALSQVTNLLNRAVTLSTEAANGTLTSTQASSANQEYQNILTQIAAIGSTTNFNSNNVFSSTARTVFVSDGTASGANVYSNVVGSLKTTSVGESSAVGVASNIANPSGNAGTTSTGVTQSTLALTTAGSGDTISGTIQLGVTNGSLHTFSVGTPGDGTATALAISNDATFQAEGISATFSGTTLTIKGPADGTKSVVLGTDALHNVTANSAVTGNTIIPGVTGTSVATFALGAANDTFGGSLSIGYGGVGPYTINVAAGTTGTDLAGQINNNSSFSAAQITASYSSTTATLTISGPAGASGATTLSTTGTALTSVAPALAGAAPGAGIDFSNAAISTLNAGSAQQVLTSVTSAIADVAYQRGIIGADVNELTAASGVASSESENLTAAETSIRSTDYGSATSDLAKYKVLSETGISALAQANSVQQEVTKLLQ